MFNISKQLFDFLLAGLLAIITLPFQVLFLVILAIELTENPLFLQKRGVSYHNKYFTIFKFRTIASKQSDRIRHNTSNDIFEAVNSSGQTTPLANWLRQTGLDELPQIYNILLGKMSFIGPRPFMIQDLKNLDNEHPLQSILRGKLKSKPGITGLWQISSDRKLGVDNLVGLDLFYEKNKSFKLDLQILFSTIMILVFDRSPSAVFSRFTFKTMS